MPSADAAMLMLLATKVATDADVIAVITSAPLAHFSP